MSIFDILLTHSRPERKNRLIDVLLFISFEVRQYLYMFIRFLHLYTFILQYLYTFIQYIYIHLYNIFIQYTFIYNILIYIYL